MSKLVNEDSIPQLLREMTVKEKLDLLIGKSFFLHRNFQNTEFLLSDIWMVPPE